MQETQYEDKTIQEFFKGETDEEVVAKMDARLNELQGKGHTLVRRVKIGRNEPCPCGSGLKFKKCCISKVDQGLV